MTTEHKVTETRPIIGESRLLLALAGGTTISAGLAFDHGHVGLCWGLAAAAALVVVRMIARAAGEGEARYQDRHR